METALRVNRVLVEKLGNGISWNSQTSLRDRRGLDLDSLDMVELAMMLENEFRLTIPDDACCGWSIVGDISDWLEANQPRALFAA
jgi:acyl carrier protein